MPCLGNGLEGLTHPHPHTHTLTHTHSHSLRHAKTPLHAVSADSAGRDSVQLKSSVHPSPLQLTPPPQHLCRQCPSPAAPHPHPPKQVVVGRCVHEGSRSPSANGVVLANPTRKQKIANLFLEPESVSSKSAARLFSQLNSFTTPCRSCSAPLLSALALPRSAVSAPSLHREETP